MASVLVTGGAGFIGSHLVDALVAKGQEVVVVDNLTEQVHPSRPSYLNRDASYVFGDLRDEETLDVALSDAEIVYHLASAVGVGQSMYRIEDYVSANISATARLLQRIVDARTAVGRLVVASSMSIYGEGSYRCPEDGTVYPHLREELALAGQLWEPRCPECHGQVEAMPTAESKPLAPASVYAITKRDQEEMSLTVGRAYGIPTVALRFFNVYGPRQTLSNPYTGVCAIFESRIRNDKPPLIYEDGRQTRDFVSVHDVANACLLAGERSAADFQAINIASGRGTSILDIAETLLRLSGRDLQPRMENAYRTGDVRHCFADVSRAGELLRYHPRVSLEEGLGEFVEWSDGQVVTDRSEAAQRELAERGLVRG